MDALGPLPYHREVVAALRQEEPGLWSWFASDEVEAAYAEQVRLELLKTTVRLERGRYAALHEAADAARGILDLDVAVSFYQAAGAGSLNAGVCHLPGEAHIVLSGPVLDRLDGEELRALVGHELAHQKLLLLDDGAYRTAQLLLHSIADQGGADAYLATAERIDQLTEVYADRGGSLVAGADAVVRCLAKTVSGLREVDAPSYRAQAAEVVAGGGEGGAGTHPETFLRVHLLSEWARDPAAGDVLAERLIRGPLRMDALDLPAQLALLTTTRALVARCLAEPLLRTERTQAHAASFFGPEPPGADPHGSNRVVLPEPLHPSVAEYLAYVLLDMATCDDELGDLALGLVDRLAAEVGLGEPYEALVRKELRRTKKALVELRAGLDDLQRAARTQLGGTP